jgi:type III secretion protein J
MKNRISFILLPLILFSCKAEILHSVPEEQANEIITVLSEYGIRAEKVSDGKGDKTSFNILVDESEYGKSWNILKENGLPREKIKGLSDIYQKQGFISSSIEERALLVQAIKGELEKTLETIDNVVRARVIISIPTSNQSPFAQGNEKIGASVLLKVKKNTYINKETVKGILLGAVPSLDKEKISVEIVETQKNIPTREISMTYIGPFLVSTNSAKIFYTFIIGVMLVLVLALGYSIFTILRQRQNVEKEVAEL